MFKTIKEKTQLCDVISKYTGEETKMIGESATLDSDTCPFCSHKDCFRIKLETEDGGFYHCFSCGEHGDAISFVQTLNKLTSPVDAAKLIAKDFNIQLPTNINPIQEVFSLAARYYRTCLQESTTKYPELNSLTPEQYQLKVRGHLPSTLETLQVGWSDGNLVTYLKGVGIDDSILETSGLINKSGKDFLPAKCFIYPHLVKGKVSHFTFKDPLKKLSFQLKNSNKLNGHQWYNQDALGMSDTIMLVEGENDLASIIDAGSPNVIASIGQLSSSQIEWLVENYEGKNIITLFDPDPAGDKYREKIQKAKGRFGIVRHIVPPNDKDIDDNLREGKLLKDILKVEAIVEDEASIEAEKKIESLVSSELDVLEDKGYYSKVRYKEGVPYFTKISDFVMKLTNVFIDGGKREREVQFTREDGKTRSCKVTSEIKTSLRAFKVCLSDAVDGNFTGTESDLATIWQLVYRKGGENEVLLIDHVGQTPHGWLFGDKLITESGRLISADDTDVFWPESTLGTKDRVGVKPRDLDAEGDDSNRDMPKLVYNLTSEENQEFLETFIVNLARNLGSPGRALVAIGLLRAIAHSKWFIQNEEHFPHLWFTGKSNAGKTTIIGWLLRIFGMEDKGHFTIGTMTTSVASERKISYYSSLPICIDELRNDETLRKYQPVFRTWYDRRGRDKGTNDNHMAVRKGKIRACILYAGQDIPTDPAFMERLLIVDVLDPLVKTNNRETRETYKWITKHYKKLPSIGYHWIRESLTASETDLNKALEECCEVIVNTGVAYRFSVNFGLAKIMADEYAKKLFPDFEWEQYIIGMAQRAQKLADQEDVICKYFETAEALTMGNNPKITSDHYKVEGNVLYVHYNSVFDEVIKESHRTGIFSETFSREAIKKRFLEHEWCLANSTRKHIGIRGELKRVIAIDLERAPEYIKTFAKYNIGEEDKVQK